jgi:hypothetical protein
MQVFVPYPSPIDVAKCLDQKRLRKQIIECEQILNAISGDSQAWRNHPATNTYEPYYSWLHDYCLCLEYYLDGNYDMAEYWNLCANGCTPPFLTSDFCDQHKRRLYTKAPELYPQFASYGKSDENWYFVDGQIVKYINGKRI